MQRRPRREIIILKRSRERKKKLYKALKHWPLCEQNLPRNFVLRQKKNCKQYETSLVLFLIHLPPFVLCLHHIDPSLTVYNEVTVTIKRHTLLSSSVHISLCQILKILKNHENVFLKRIHSHTTYDFVHV